jgi:hypothetical protein
MLRWQEELVQALLQQPVLQQPQLQQLQLAQQQGLQLVLVDKLVNQVNLALNLQSKMLVLVHLQNLQSQQLKNIMM